MLAHGAKSIDLDCGIAYNRIAAWLDGELALPHVGPSWIFTHEQQNCRVSITPLEPRPLGKLALERTRLIAEGDSEALAEFDRLFTLRFVSAGG